MNIEKEEEEDCEFVNMFISNEKTNWHAQREKQ